MSPEEQLRFLRRLVRYDLPVHRQHIEAVMAAFLMPPGQITNAAGAQDFTLTSPGPLVVRAKSGYTTVGTERVSWLIGHVQAKDRQSVFVSRVRAHDALPATAATDLARRVLNARGLSSR